jgi:hypothetical protein
MLRTGAPWRDLPERYGPWRTVASRFYRWQRAGIWSQLLAAVPAQADAQGQLNWDVHCIDGTMIRAHQHAAGATKGTQSPTPSAAAGAGSVPTSTMDAQTRQVIAFHVGDRSRASGKALWATIPLIYQEQAMFHTDQYGLGVAKVEILAKSCGRLRGPFQRQPLAHVQRERPVRIDVRPQ